MSTAEIQISRQLAIQLLHLAQISPEYEICGLIGGKNNQPTQCYPIKNVAAEPQQQFLLDAEQQIAAMVAMRNQGEELFAIYHSHPKAPAAPSASDLALAAYEEAVYFIISLNIKGVLEMRAFKIRQKVAEELTLILCV